MKVTYDTEADVLCFRLRTTQIEEGDELEPGLIVSHDKAGNIVCLEILNASKRYPDLKTQLSTQLSLTELISEAAQEAARGEEPTE